MYQDKLMSLIELGKEITGSLHGSNLKDLDSFFHFGLMKKASYLYILVCAKCF